MNILHIALTDGGGAGMGMMNQHHALLRMGIDSRVLVAIKRGTDPTVVAMRPNLHIWGTSRGARLAQRVACRLGICLNAYDRCHHLIYKVRKRWPAEFDAPFSQYDVLRHPLVNDADIINLHYTSGMVDVPSFFSHVDKPVVWTMRDESPGLGGFHYTEDRQRLYRHYAALENSFLDIKRQAISQCPRLHIVSLSPVMRHFCQGIDYLASRPNTIIYNAISPRLYRPCQREEARQRLGLCPDDILIAFVCCALGEERKGFSIALDAVRLLEKRMKGKTAGRHVKLLCAGRNDTGIVSAPDVVMLGTQADPRQLSMAYAAADLFLNASSQESFGKTIVEALYSGTPVVSTPVGIAPAAITPHNGCLCAQRTPQAIAQAMATVLDSGHYDPTRIRQEAIEMFAPERVAAQYDTLYQSILKA